MTRRVAKKLKWKEQKGVNDKLRKVINAHLISFSQEVAHELIFRRQQAAQSADAGLLLTERSNN